MVLGQNTVQVRTRHGGVGTQQLTPQDTGRSARYGMAWAVLKKVLKNRPTPSWGEDAVQDMVLLASQRPDLPQWKLWLRCQDIVVKYQRKEQRERPTGLDPSDSGGAEEGRESVSLAPVDERLAAAERVSVLMSLPWTDQQMRVLEAVYSTGNPFDAAAKLGWSNKRVANTLATIRLKAEAAGLGTASQG